MLLRAERLVELAMYRPRVQPAKVIANQILGNAAHPCAQCCLAIEAVFASPGLQTGHLKNIVRILGVQYALVNKRFQFFLEPGRQIQGGVEEVKRGGEETSSRQFIFYPQVCAIEMISTKAS